MARRGSSGILHQQLASIVLLVFYRSRPINALPLSSTPDHAPSALQARSGSPDLPTCMYNFNDGTKGHGQCPNEHWGSPNPAYCDQSIIEVCAQVSQLPPGNDTSMTAQTGFGQNDGDGADCVAAVNNGNAPGVTLAYPDCISKFQSLQGCAETTNENYNADCIGAVLNSKYNDNEGHETLPLDISKPRFALSTPKFFGIVTANLTLIHPEPQLSSDTSQAAYQVAQSQQQSGAASSSKGSTGGFGAAVSRVVLGGWGSPIGER